MASNPPSPGAGRSAGIGAYLKAAFLYHWNLLLFFGGAGLAALSGRPDALLPIVGGLEIAYLTGLLALPRFRTAIDAQAAARARGRPAGGGAAPPPPPRPPPARGGRAAAGGGGSRGVGRADPTAQESLQRMIQSLPAPSLQ